MQEQMASHITTLWRHNTPLLRKSLFDTAKQSFVVQKNVVKQKLNVPLQSITFVRLSIQGAFFLVAGNALLECVVLLA